MVKWDVTVVGAGPAGSTTAEHLAAAGLKVALFEKSDTPGKNNVCAGMFCMPCARDFDIDPLIFEKVIYRGIHFFDFAAVNLESKDGIVTILRDQFDNYLAKRATGKGAELITRTRVIDVKVIRAGLVEVTFQREQGNIESMLCRAVVLADGPHTLSRRFPGLGFQKTPENLSFAFSYDVEAKENTMEHFEMYYDRNLADWGYGWVFPKKDILNFGLVCRVSEYERDKSILTKRLQYLWKEHPRASKVLHGRRLIRKRGAMIPQRIARKIVHESIVVVGDAAGMADAVFGGGIENAMYAGQWAARVLKEALEEDRLDSEYLGRYQTMWESSKRYKMTSFAETCRDWGCKINTLHPNIPNRLKYLLVLKTKMKSRGMSGIINTGQLMFSSNFRRSLEIYTEKVPCEF